MIRLDGRQFSKLTKKFDKPFDLRSTRQRVLALLPHCAVHHAMIDTCKKLFMQFRPSVIFTFSDEISMLFPAQAVEKVHRGT